MFEYFYHEILRRTVISFGSLFNDISIKHTDNNNNVKSIIKEIYGDVMNKNKYFKFYLTKKGNQKPIKKETETI